MRTIHRPVTSLFSIITSLFSYHNIPSAMATPHHHRLLEYNVCLFHLPPAFLSPSVRRSLSQLAKMGSVVRMLAYSAFEI